MDTDRSSFKVLVTVFALLMVDAHASAQEAPAEVEAAAEDASAQPTTVVVVTPDADTEPDVDVEEVEVEPENHYTDEGNFELGGTIGLDWTEELFTISAGPTFGWFVVDRFELSALVRVDYQNAEQPDGSREHSEKGSIIIEPSYHLPLQRESLFGQFGVGLGVGYDGDDADFEVIPRLGLNIEIGSAGVLTPAVRMPILMGNSHGEDGEFGTDIGVGFEIGVTTVL
jgi:hypothetical protein